MVTTTLIHNRFVIPGTRILPATARLLRESAVRTFPREGVTASLRAVMLPTGAATLLTGEVMPLTGGLTMVLPGPTTPAISGIITAPAASGLIARPYMAALFSRPASIQATVAAVTTASGKQTAAAK